MSKRHQGAAGGLILKLESGSDLASMDSNGFSDPYAIISCTFNQQKFKSKVHKKTLNPVWNETFTFLTSSPQGSITIKLMDRDPFWSKDDFLGEVVIPIATLLDGRQHTNSYPVANEPKEGKKKGQRQGQIKLTLHFPGGKKEAPPTTSSGQVEKSPQSQKQKKTVHELYEFGNVLGTGGFSVVKKARHKASGVDYAIKIIQKDSAAPEEIQLLYSEIDIMQKLQHPNIITLQEVFEDDKTLFLVLELVNGGELFDQIVGKGSFPENEAALIVEQILKAVDYMHSNGIAHRDLKPENLLCSDSSSSKLIKVTDFGLSKDFGRASMKTSCGTPDYVAPEVLKGAKYDNSVDLWSIGVITYILVCGFPPFYGADEQQVFAKILKCDFAFPSPDWTHKSEDVKEFISSILVLEVNQRPTASQCLESPWIKKYSKTK